MFLKRFIKFSIFLIFIIFLNCTKSDKNFFIESKGTIFGSNYTIKYQSKKNYQFFFDSIFQEINKSVNTYDDKSILSKWNNNYCQNILIDMHLKKLFIKSKKLYKLSDGFFDPTASILVNFYGFGCKNKWNKNSVLKVDSILDLVGINKVILYNNCLIKLHPNIQIDFNSIAPGYTVDLISNFLDSKKINNYLIDIGGEIKTKVSNNKRFWRIGIEYPNQGYNERKIIHKIQVRNKALGTSGNYRKFSFNINGNKISHIINPKTGRAIVNDLLSVTVITKYAVDADALSTIGMVLGLKRAQEFYCKYNISSFLIYQKNNKIESTYIGDFKSFIME